MWSWRSVEVLLRKYKLDDLKDEKKFTRPGGEGRMI